MKLGKMTHHHIPQKSPTQHFPIKNYNARIVFCKFARKFKQNNGESRLIASWDNLS